MKMFSANGFKSMAALLPLLVVTALAGCGGGGGDDDGDGGTANAAPTVDAGAAQEVLARTDVALEAVASDADGSVASYAWTQTAGTSATLATVDGSSLEFTAPEVAEEEALTFSVTVTDDGGETATDTVNVTVTPSVNMRAKAYDGPLANATVMVTVGDTTYTATTDAEGVFELRIGSPDPAAMITIVAMGGEGQENAELVSIAGTFGALIEAAGEDGTLESSESGAVDVTNLSTAKAVLMIAANGGEAPADDDALTDLEKNLDVNAVVELATVIKLVIDEGVALPEGVESTYDLAGSDSAVNAVIETAEATQAGIFESTMNDMLADDNLTPSFDADDFPGLYFVNRVGGYVTSNRGFTVDLREGGSGYVYGAGPDVSAEMTWALDANGKLNITLAEMDPFVTRGTCGAGVTCDVTVTALQVSLITDGAVVDSIRMTETGSISYPFNPEMPAEALSGSALYLAMDPGALEPFVAADVTGTWSVPLSYPNPDPVGDRYETDLLTFNADGTGTRPADGITFTWSVDADGVLGVAFSDGDALDLYALRTEGELALDAMAVMTTAGGDTYTLAHLVVTGVDADYPGTLTLADFDGDWAYADWGSLYYAIDSLAGSATATYTNASGAIVAQYPAGITYNAGKLDVVSWVDVTGPPPNPSISNCADASGDCFYSYSSTWTPLVQDGSGRIFLLEKDRGWDYDAANTTDFRGNLNYRHGTNRWILNMPGEMAAMSSGAFKAASVDTFARGDRVRRLLNERRVFRNLH